MKKHLFSAVAAVAMIAGTQKAAAQTTYTVTTQTATYQSLTGATLANQNRTWNSDSVFTLPLGFNFKLDGQNVTSMTLVMDGLLAHTGGAKSSGFAFLSTSLRDRGLISGTSRSPIRYLTSGNAGSRIFKLELFNAGLDDERMLYNTNKDSINLQIWMYEGSNAVELRYGSSRLTDFNDYFGTFLYTGYLRNLDLNTSTVERFYFLKGATASPVVDSTNMIPPNAGFTNMPAAGTVYRFTPKNSGTGIPDASRATFAKVFPTLCNNALNIEQTSGQPLRYDVMNSAGVLVMSGPATGTQRQTIDVSEFPGGLYYLKITNGEGASQLEKFIKQ